MAPYNRKELILDYMRNKSRFVTVEQLCQSLFVSGATIRRDLTELETSRLIRRTRGGAILVEGSASEDPLALRESKNSLQKQMIATAALHHIRDGMTLFLDSSSTVFALAQNLDRFSNLQVITNGLKTSLILSDFNNIHVMCTGGALQENSKSLVGQSAVEYIGRFNADIAFLSCRGFSLENGASEASEGEHFIKRQFIENSKKCVLLCDSSKWNIDYLCRSAPLSRFAEIITERKDINDLCKTAIMQQT